MKKRSKIILAAVIIFIVIFGAGFLLLGKDKALGLEIGAPDIPELRDGVYIGSYSGHRWSNTVEVTVKDGRITAIDVIEPQKTASEETIEAVKGEIIASQTPAVDAVSGATADSNAFMKAVENALKNGVTAE